MPITVSVMYESVEDATFDLDYYLGRHMPMVGARFAPFGATGWRVLKAVAGPSGERPRFSIIATLEFASAGQFEAAVAAEGEAVFGDVPNFSSTAPVVVVGELVGASEP